MMMDSEIQTLRIRAERVEAEDFVLRDKDGKGRGWWRMNQNGTVIFEAL